MMQTGWLWSVVLVAVLASGSAAADGSFFVYGASADSEDLVAARITESDGRLTAKLFQRESLGFEAAPVIYDTTRRRLYVASLRPKQGRRNQLSVFAVGTDGRLTKVKQLPMAHGSAYLSLDRTARFLLGVSYFEGHVDVYELDQLGVPKQRVQTVFARSDKAHAVLPSRDNRFVYIPYVKDQNNLLQYGFDATTGKLRPLEPSAAKVPNGVGPRHIAYHPTQPFVFFSNEQHLGATSYRIDRDGQLELIGVCAAGELKAGPGLAASDIKITPDGRYLYVGVRDFEQGKVDAVHRYQVGSDGKLKHLGQTPTDAIPWGLNLSPSGRDLLVTAFRGETLTAFAIAQDGSLTKRLSLKWGKHIRAVAVVADQR